MVKLHKHLYLDKDASEKIQEIKNIINTNRVLSGLYVIALASNPNEQLDIFSYPMFCLEKKQRDQLTVVGIARGKESAIELVKTMAADSMAEGGKCDLRSLFD